LLNLRIGLPCLQGFPRTMRSWWLFCKLGSLCTLCTFTSIISSPFCCSQHDGQNFQHFPHLFNLITLPLAARLCVSFEIFLPAFLSNSSQRKVDILPLYRAVLFFLSRLQLLHVVFVSWNYITFLTWFILIFSSLKLFPFSS
jgi:hypothetical protein